MFLHFVMIITNKVLLEFSVIAIAISYKTTKGAHNSCENYYDDENESNLLPIGEWLEKISDPTFECNESNLNQEKGSRGHNLLINHLVDLFNY